ncbi:MAG: hypothetical protein J6X59_06685 [Bacteroidales bacterium]|nr:hypothetical protein [Bacteroidales bacterium]
MPMFYAPKPRQFNYRPRFYDPKKERREELKRKYLSNPEDASQEELEYFNRRLRELDEREKHSQLTWKDMFRKRKMPTFEYKPRFESGTLPRPADESTTLTKELDAAERRERIMDDDIKIHRRFDYYEDFERKHRRVFWVTTVVLIACCCYILYHRDTISYAIYQLFY